METFRCYALDERGTIIAAEHIEAEDRASAIKAGWEFVTTVNSPGEGRGLEIWQNTTKIFPT
jgi:hypothetical protein